MSNAHKTRIALGVEYLGHNYHGFQQLKHEKQTIQEKLIHAIAQINQELTPVQAAGRTDAGVHALGQVVHFDTTKTRKLLHWSQGVNRFLPSDICIQWSAQVSDEFHARYSAISRSYDYIICNQSLPSTWWNKRALVYHQPLSVAHINKSLMHLIGTHDFTSFRHTHCQAKNPIRHITSATCQLEKNNTLRIKITANAFLHHMIRNIVGTLLNLQRKKQPPETIKWILEQKNRKYAGEKISPYGLYLRHVEYPEDLFLEKFCCQPLYMP